MVSSTHQMNRWSRLPYASKIKPEGRSRCSLVYDENHLYLFGGRLDSFQSSNELFRYNLKTCTWDQLTREEDNIPARSQHSAVVYNRKMYIYGGCEDMGTDVYMFDLKTQKWSIIRAPNPPGLRSGHSAVVFNKEMYVFGGEQGRCVKWLDVHRFNLETHKWQELQCNYRHGRSRHSAVVYGCGMYVFGGEYLFGITNDLSVLNLRTNQWTELITTGDVPKGREGHTAAVYKDKMIVVGGWIPRHGRVCQIYELDLCKKIWKQIVTCIGNEPPPRVYHCGVLIDDNETFYVFGGRSLDANLNDLYQLEMNVQPERFVKNLWNTSSNRKFGDIVFND